MIVEAWLEDFGNDYRERNQDLQGRALLWERVFTALPEMPLSILEVGANIGLNLEVISYMTDARLIGLEPNELSRNQIGFEKLAGTSEEIDLQDGEVDMAFTCGVLIHIKDIARSCDEIYRVSSRYIVCVEYFSDKFVEIPYRGQDGMLWKQDFGKFWMDNYDLSLIDYGFLWKPVTDLDNLTYWIFEKN